MVWLDRITAEFLSFTFSLTSHAQKLHINSQDYIQSENVAVQNRLQAMY